VQISDAFMQAVEGDEDWVTKWVTTGQDGPVFKARDLWKKIAESTWLCGDPGVQFSDTTNNYNTIPHVGRIVASNPCAEYLSINSSACNLASINLLKFLKNGKFDYETFQKVVRILIIAQDILVDRASYPLKDIARNAHRCRQLGLGYTNLGALIMSMGLPYDSEEARDLCGFISAILTARAYLTSSELAGELGQFEDFDSTAMMAVLNKHADATGRLPGEAGNLASDLWEDVLACENFRNSQVSLCAPCGTISFLLDCDTTGIEPELALVKTKTLVGGGTLVLVNKSVEAGLKALGISDGMIASILEYLEKNQTLVGSVLTEDEMKVFATSLGDNQILWEAHLKMMAASQPFLSGGISKTVNLPNYATVEDIQNAYRLGWKLGLKSVAIYRDGSKGSQPLNIKHTVPETISVRKRLPDTRESITHKFTINGHKGYFTVGLYPNGQPGEIFISVAKEGSTLGGIFDCFGLATSIGLQYGVPLSEFIDKFTHVRFEPMGFTKNKDIKIAKSIIDYIFRWLAIHFTTVIPHDVNEPTIGILNAPLGTLDSPICGECGSLTTRVGACFLCYGCGTSGGCS
jgi:ribonucleoside-diphosphate reductase alpha chain